MPRSSGVVRDIDPLLVAAVRPLDGVKCQRVVDARNWKIEKVRTAFNRPDRGHSRRSSSLIADLDYRASGPKRHPPFAGDRRKIARIFVL